MTSEQTTQMIKIISENILTPIIYMIEHEDIVDFICFCDRNITMQEIYDTELKLKDIVGKDAEIIDIREFVESERLDVINRAVLIHSEHPLIEKVFEQSMLEDFKIAMAERKDVLERHKESGMCYLQ
ncbi:MAG: hypothetical protein LIO53_08080 [Oscillospiraceae bacterium]|nr:hypothetical protein [Oscillospiraceae bacterium]